MTKDRNTAGTSTYPKGGVSCSKDSIAANQTLVFKSSFVVKVPPFGSLQNVTANLNEE